MADQAITALPKKTYSGSSQIASTDYLLGIDSAEGYQMLIQDLGEYIINRVTASLAGSNQTLAAAISALNSNIKAMPDTDNGRLMYRSDAHADSLVNNIVLTRTGCPENDFFYIKTMAYTKKQDGTVSTGHQIALSYNNDDRIYTRRCESGTWRPWVKVPTRAEMDAVTNASMHWLGGDLTSIDNIPNGVSCFYIQTNAIDGIAGGWYIGFKCSPSGASKECVLIGTTSQKVYALQYRTNAWTIKTLI